MSNFKFYCVLNCTTNDDKIALLRCNFNYDNLARYIGKTLKGRLFNVLKRSKENHRDLNVICNINICNPMKVFMFRKNTGI